MNKNICENEYDCLRLVIKPFNQEEKVSIREARKSIGIDRPRFYHDAIVKYADDIRREKNADQ